MYSCPECGAEEVASRATCVCGADLVPLQRLDSVADAWFNRALESLAGGATGRALEWLSASCAARPTDVAARLAQAKVWAQLGHCDEARDALERAAAIDPDAAELEIIRTALDGISRDLETESMDEAQRPAVPTHAPAAQRRSAKRTAKKKKANRKRAH
jgi:predicted Zn-dependent protease